MWDLCRGAGIGIQDSLKNYCPHGLKGSSPFPGKRFRSHHLGGIFILYGEAHQLLGARRDLTAGAMFEFVRKRYHGAQGENREARPEGFFRQEKDRREVSFPGKDLEATI